MTHNDFFKQLRDELHGHPLRDRFLEELKDHTEDLEDVEKPKNEFARSEMRKKYLGEPRQIKENFMKIMHPLGKLLFVLEAFCYGLLIFPISFVFFINVSDSGSIADILSSIFRSTVYLITLFIIYTLYFKRYLNIKATMRKSLVWWIIFISLPTGLWLISSIFSTLYALWAQTSPL